MALKMSVSYPGFDVRDEFLVELRIFDVINIHLLVGVDGEADWDPDRGVDAFFVVSEADVVE
jgi:hypothetical protein